MSQCQYYEFVALDRPPTTDEVRELSTRTTITATSFVNEYHGAIPRVYTTSHHVQSCCAASAGSRAT